MIASLSGPVRQLGATSAVVEVGGLGVLAQCTPTTAASLRLGEPATLATSLVVREDSLTLYAFSRPAERDAFELLLTATGVGPKLAQAVLAVLSPEELAAALRSDDLVKLTKVPGIGRKGAQRLVLELTDKVAMLAPSELPATAEIASPRAAREPWREQVSAGLQGLGWSARDAEGACDQVAPLAREDPDLAVAELMRAALRSLARG